MRAVVVPPPTPPRARAGMFTPASTGPRRGHLTWIAAPSKTAKLIMSKHCSWPLECRLLLPCVSNRWARILGQPGAWELAHIDLQALHKRNEDHEDPGRPFLEKRAVYAWLGR